MSTKIKKIILGKQANLIFLIYNGFRSFIKIVQDQTELKRANPLGSLKHFKFKLYIDGDKENSYIYPKFWFVTTMSIIIIQVLIVMYQGNYKGVSLLRKRRIIFLFPVECYNQIIFIQRNYMVYALCCCIFIRRYLNIVASFVYTSLYGCIYSKFIYGMRALLQCQAGTESPKNITVIQDSGFSSSHSYKIWSDQLSIYYNARNKDNYWEMASWIIGRVQV